MSVHALLLAAGVSRRLRGTLDDRPKCLLEFGGRTLLHRHLRNLGRFGVNRVSIVVGYRADRIREALPSDVPILVDLVMNERFEEGSILSLRVGLSAVSPGESALIMDADVLYDPSALDRLLTAGEGFLLDESSPETGEEMMLAVRDGRVRTIARRVGPDWDLAGEGMGFFLCPAKFVEALARQVETTLVEADPRQEYEAALDAFLRSHPAGYCLVGDLRWTEIDFPEDIRKAREEILPAVEAGERALGLL